MRTRRVPRTCWRGMAADVSRPASPPHSPISCRCRLSVRPVVVRGFENVARARSVDAVRPSRLRWGHLDPPRVSSEGSFCLLLPLFLPVLSAHYFLVSLSLRGDCCFVPLQRPFLCDSKCGTACPIADEFKQPERREGAQPRCDLRHSRHARVVLVVG